MQGTLKPKGKHMIYTGDIFQLLLEIANSGLVKWSYEIQKQFSQMHQTVKPHPVQTEPCDSALKNQYMQNESYFLSSYNLIMIYEVQRYVIL